MRDITYATRSFLRTPGFTTVAVLTLALGIGATTAIFSVVDAVLLEPLPYPQADRLVVARMSLPDYRDVQRAARSFEGTAVWASNLYNLRTGGDTQQILGGVVSRELLPLLGVAPVLGRTFAPDDERGRTVVIGYGLWQSRFGGDPSVLGRGIELSGNSYTIIGVAPAWFRYPGAEFQLWTAMSSIETSAAQAKNRALRIFRVVGRLNPGVTIAQAQGEMDTIGGQLAKTHPATNANVTITVEPLYEHLVGEARPALMILLATVGLLLLIACANVANLMLARTTSREREMAIRSALGAGRRRILRQLATESLVLAAAGGGIGLLLAMWGVDGLPAALEARVPRADSIEVDATVLAFATGATLLTGIFFGLAPAWQGSTSSASLKDGGRGVAGTSRGRRVRRVIVVAEIALAVVVVVGAGLLVRSFVMLTTRDPGFVAKDLYSFTVQLVSHPDQASRAQAAAALMDRMAQLHGVEMAGAATGLAAVTPQRGTRIEIEGRALSPDEAGVLFIATTPGYFRTMSTPVLRGREIEAIDRPGAQPVAVINRRMAIVLFGADDPIGRRLRIINPEYAPDWRTIVGVVGDVTYQGLDAEVPPTLYTPYAQTPFLWLYVMLRTNGAAPNLASAVRSAVPAVDPRLNASNVKPMTETVAGTVAEPRFNMWLVASFAVLALALAAIGLYGVIAYSVVQRTHEIGVRMALGAVTADVMRLVLGEGLVLAAAGVAIGLAGSAMLTRLMANQLVGITPRDPLTFTGSGLLLLGVALFASYVPARRSSRVDPVVALRAE
jgi:putative ABC transport system permease protein